ncbi:hypothetical protein [Mesobacillus foraminis]|nr:hypothetical protein [Mesobacillus foraminis]
MMVSYLAFWVHGNYTVRMLVSRSKGSLRWELLLKAGIPLALEKKISC